MQSNCTECNNGDATLFLYDHDADSTICTACGFVNADMHWLEYSSLPIPIAPETGEGPTDVPVQPRKKICKFSYHRPAYLTERLRQSRLGEPRIPKEKLDLIQQEYEEFSHRNYFQNLRKRDGIINKRDIQFVLRSLDRKLSPKKKEYTTKYLEKWMSIKKFLGGAVRTYTYEEYVKVGTRLAKLSQKWDINQPRSRKDTRDNWIFKQRMDFPGFNFLTQRINKQLGIKGMGSAFPLPVTKPALKKLSLFAEFLDPTLPVFHQKKLTDFFQNTSSELVELLSLK